MSLFTQTMAASAEVSDALVVALGIGMVFFGLVCLIVICYALGAVMKLFSKNSSTTPTPAVKAVNPAPCAPVPVNLPIENKQELIAAVSCAIAEELGTDVSAIRIKSIKRIGEPVYASPAQNRQELVAAISCAIAEELGTDVSAIRIKSIKQI